MHTIWKFPVEINDKFTIRLPRGAKFLSVQTQFIDPQMWWLVDPEAVKTERHFRVHGTGHEVYQSGALTFLGTFQISGGQLVFHLFEER